MDPQPDDRATEEVPADNPPPGADADEAVDEAPEQPPDQAPDLDGVELVEPTPSTLDATGLDGASIGMGLVALVVLVALVAWFMRRPPASLEELEDRAIPTPDVVVPTPDLVERRATPSLVERFRDRLGRSRAALAVRFDMLFGRDAFDEDLLEELEEVLLIADVGVPTTERILERVRAAHRSGEKDPAALREVLRDEMRAILRDVHRPLEVGHADPFVILVVGVNGSGKTTTIGKLAARLRSEGRKVLLAAADTYRAAAAEQLQVWAQRAEAEFVRHDEGADPGAVAYDAIDAARARGCDVVIVDTAGRLQTRRPLMEQLGKVRRVIDKKVPGAPHETLLVVDGTMGQNAMSQAENFHAATPLTGVVVTKLDGTAKGGMILAIADQRRLPVVMVGIGEQVDDLRPFDVDAFVDALT